MRSLWTPRKIWAFDRSSWSHLRLAIVGLTLGCAAAYTFPTHYNCGHGIKTDHEKCIAMPWQDAIGNALYFSIATETTLGYGDLAPQGFSRYVACFQAVFGLIIAGLVVAKITTGPSGKTRILIDRMSGAWIEFCYKEQGVIVSLIQIKYVNDLLRYDGLNFDPTGTYLGTFKGSSEPTASIKGSEIWFDYSNQEGDLSYFSAGQSRLCFSDLGHNPSVYNSFTGHAQDIKRGKVVLGGIRATEDQASIITSFNLDEATMSQRSKLVRDEFEKANPSLGVVQQS